MGGIRRVAEHPPLTLSNQTNQLRSGLVLQKTKQGVFPLTSYLLVSSSEHNETLLCGMSCF